MSLKNAYLNVAHRSLTAAGAALQQNLPESTGFIAYHAFESVGGAVCASHNRAYSLSHVKKMNQFVALSNNQPYRYAVAAVAILLSSTRNHYLYPELQNDGSIKEPKDQITNADAERLLNRVSGIYNTVRNRL